MIHFAEIAGALVRVVHRSVDPSEWWVASEKTRLEGNPRADFAAIYLLCHPDA